MYFFYQKTMLGKWTPRTSSYFPDRKKPEGGVGLPVRQVITLPDHQADMTLTQLESAYPLDQAA